MAGVLADIEAALGFWDADRVQDTYDSGGAEALHLIAGRVRFSMDSKAHLS